ncbi:hypothetical protein [Streptomyces sp. bgisy027]|uniref:hypothetical protein n=1 Tax=Streptomyces sp. bgisy027 TaxID=3413770 RepID=UPI003D7275ED
MIRDMFPPSDGPAPRGSYRRSWASAEASGSWLGGLLVDHASYRWIFWTGSLLALLSVVAVLTLLPRSVGQTPGRIDLPGTVLLALGITPR